MYKKLRLSELRVTGVGSNGYFIINDADAMWVDQVRRAADDQPHLGGIGCETLLYCKLV